MEQKKSNEFTKEIKSVKIELPPNLFTYLKENDKRLVEVKHLGGHSVLGTTYLMELKSIKDDTSEQCVFRLFNANRLLNLNFLFQKQWD